MAMFHTDKVSYFHAVATTVLLCSAADSLGEFEPRWERGESFTGVGEVVKDFPTFTDWLHIERPDLGLSGEMAHFHIDTNEATEIDRYIFCNSENKIEVELVDWFDSEVAEFRFRWSATGGQINENGVFTAGTQPWKDASVTSFIKDPEQGAHGEEIQRTFDGLQVYMVGVRVQPGNVEYWETAESDRYDSPVKPNQSGELNALTSSASNQPLPGTDAGRISGEFQVIGITSPSGGGGDIIGSIAFDAGFTASGSVSVSQLHGFLKRSGSSITATVLSLASAAGIDQVNTGIDFVSKLAGIAGSGSLLGAVGGTSFVQFGVQKKVDKTFNSFEGFGDGGELLTIGDVGFSDLASRSSFEIIEGHVINGAYDVRTHAQIEDHSEASGGRLEIRGKDVMLGSFVTRPTYVNERPTVE